MELFQRIEKPSEVTLILVFNACAQLQTTEALDLVKKISSNLAKSLGIHPYLTTSMLDALMKCGDVKSAESIFIGLTKKSPEMYGAMMNGNTDRSNSLLDEDDRSPFCRIREERRAKKSH